MCNRKFGIELEGYVGSDLIDDVGSYGDFQFVEDGSIERGGEEYDCSHCDGSGNQECDECDGSGRIECEECGGSGEEEIECEICGGSGEEDDEECSHCGGSGEQTMSCCECDGRGDIRCGECDGDGSVTCPDCNGSGYEYGGDDYGIEAVSGVLEYANAKQAMNTIFNYLSSEGWHTRRDCGTHVHVDARDLSIIDLQKLAVLMNAVEPILFGVLSNRSNNTYCKPIQEELVREMYIKGNEEMSRNEFGHAYYGYRSGDYGGSKYDGARYYGLNLHSYYYRGTIEFRYFPGYQSGAQAFSAIDLCVKLVELAKNVDFEQIKFIALGLTNESLLSEAIKKLEELLGVELNIGNGYALCQDTFVRMLGRNSGSIAV